MRKTSTYQALVEVRPMRLEDILMIKQSPKKGE